MADPAVLVRTATLDDVDEVIDVHIRGRSVYYEGYLPAEEIGQDNKNIRAHRDAYAERIGEPEFTVLCAQRDQRLVGFALAGPCYYRDPDPGIASELRLMFVDPDHFRRGVGAKLHEATVRAWQAAGIGSARLWVWGFNGRARAFYLSQGWQVDGALRPDHEPIGGHHMLGYRLSIPTKG